MIGPSCDMVCSADWSFKPMTLERERDREKSDIRELAFEWAILGFVKMSFQMSWHP